MKEFTKEQLDFLEKFYGLTPCGAPMLPVRDGAVTETTFVWWRCHDGPERVLAKDHWENIKGYPDAYQLNEPKTTITYID